MEQAILSILSILFFCGCCYQLIKTIVTPIPLLASQRPYARSAMQLGKFYKALAWGTMTMVFLLGTTVSFYQVFTTL
jgi:hypothetical protein